MRQFFFMLFLLPLFGQAQLSSFDIKTEINTLGVKEILTLLNLDAEAIVQNYTLNEELIVDVALNILYPQILERINSQIFAGLREIDRIKFMIVRAQDPMVKLELENQLKEEENRTKRYKQTRGILKMWIEDQDT